MNSFYSKIIDFSYFSLSSQVLEEFNKLADEFFADKIEKLKEICEVQNRTKLTWKDFEFLRVDSKSLLAEMTAQTSMLKATLILPNNSKLPESAATSKSNSLRKKRKNCKNLKRRYQNHDDQTIFLKHFPSLPPEHSYLNTKIKLHMEGDDLSLRVLKNEFMLKVDESLIKLAIGEKSKAISSPEKSLSKVNVVDGDLARVDIEKALQDQDQPMLLDNEEEQDQQAPRLAQPRKEEKCLDYFGFGFVDATTL